MPDHPQEEGPRRAVNLAAYRMFSHVLRRRYRTFTFCDRSLLG